DRRHYNNVYMQLDDYWKSISFIPHSHIMSWQQAQWVLHNKPLAEDFWAETDVVYCPAESFVPTKKAKLICTIHDVAGFEESLYPNSADRRWHCFKWRILFRCMARQADAVVTVSEFSASRIAYFFPELENRLHVIHNAPHEDFGAELAPGLIQEVDRLTGGDPYILLPGGLSLRKNAEVVLEAVPRLAAKLPGVKLIIAGYNDKFYVERLQQVDAKNVVLANYVSDEFLNALYQQADAVWFPSRYEGFGMPVIEAMTAGAPVVASIIHS
ncbi:MAG: glycosyltransferase family 4 protein, partial [Kiritimatiellaceae bacterium]|nr:glycosyltransferase family 4 protein [Kiritimatiellaceae bacterium]